MPSPPMDTSLDSAATSPYISAASSPTHFSAFYHGGDTAAPSGSLSAVPFNWEEKPGISKTKESHISTATSSNYGDAEQNLEEIDFEFDFAGQSENGSLSADELFYGGKIKPLKPPPRFQYDQNKSFDSPKSPRSPKKFIKEAFSPRHKKNDFDPFAAAAEQTSKKTVRENANETKERENASSRNNGARSLSRFRVSDLLFDPEFHQEEPTKNSSTFHSVWYKKWRIKDLLLFRSVSENRVIDKNQVQKNEYPLFGKTPQDDLTNLSFRSIENNSGTPISAHELHYNANITVPDEMKKITFLPHKQRLLGCLRFRPNAPEISKGLVLASSLSRG